MLAEPGWIIPAGRHERRYAAMIVSAAKQRNHGYFTALHKQIANGGAEALLYELGRMDFGDWHPRHIPESLLRGSALQEQQSHNLPAWEQWYLMLLHNGALPEAPPKRRNSAFTNPLLQSAQKTVARLRWEATEVALRNFLLDQGRLGVVCTKYRTSAANGWSFPTLAECRAAWEKLYGPVKWDNDVDDWGC
jgi:hypothetical protein